MMQNIKSLHRCLQKLFDIITRATFFYLKYGIEAISFLYKLDMKNKQSSQKMYFVVYVFFSKPCVSHLHFLISR